MGAESRAQKQGSSDEKTHCTTFSTESRHHLLYPQLHLPGIPSLGFATCCTHLEPPRGSQVPSLCFGPCPEGDQGKGLRTHVTWAFADPAQPAIKPRD